MERSSRRNDTLASLSHKWQQLNHRASRAFRSLTTHELDTEIAKQDLKSSFSIPWHRRLAADRSTLEKSSENYTEMDHVTYFTSNSVAGRARIVSTGLEHQDSLNRSVSQSSSLLMRLTMKKDEQSQQQIPSAVFATSRDSVSLHRRTTEVKKPDLVLSSNAESQCSADSLLDRVRQWDETAEWVLSVYETDQQWRPCLLVLTATRISIMDPLTGALYYPSSLLTELTWSICASLPGDAKGHLQWHCNETWSSVYYSHEPIGSVVHRLKECCTHIRALKLGPETTLRLDRRLLMQRWQATAHDTWQGTKLLVDTAQQCHALMSRLIESQNDTNKMATLAFVNEQGTATQVVRVSPVRTVRQVAEKAAQLLSLSTEETIYGLQTLDGIDLQLDQGLWQFGLGVVYFDWCLRIIPVESKILSESPWVQIESSDALMEIPKDCPELPASDVDILPVEKILVESAVQTEEATEATHQVIQVATQTESEKENKEELVYQEQTVTLTEDFSSEAMSPQTLAEDCSVVEDASSLSKHPPLPSCMSSASDVQQLAAHLMSRFSLEDLERLLLACDETSMNTTSLADEEEDEMSNAPNSVSEFTCLNIPTPPPLPRLVLVPSVVTPLQSKSSLFDSTESQDLALLLTHQRERLRPVQERTLKSTEDSDSRAEHLMNTMRRRLLAMRSACQRESSSESAEEDDFLDTWTMPVVHRVSSVPLLC